VAGLERQIGGFPRGDAAGDFADAPRAAALQEACSDGRPVATGAINQDVPAGRKLCEILR
jgi:hypothetical protein